MDTKTDAPSTSADFDQVYKSSFAHWMWSDVRIPKELKELIASNKPQTTWNWVVDLPDFQRL